jgi:hypothetical protein
MNEFAVQKTTEDLISVEQHRAIQEVQASMIIAKKFPRDVEAAYLRIMKACERYSLADQAEYAYPRGGKSVTGPSIRLAEVIAQNWGNMQFGIRELSQSGGASEVEAFAWDIESNTREIKTFKVPHRRYTKAKGNVDLSDPRDIYEYVANQGARRMRSCILGIVPGDIVEEAQKVCRKTLQKGIESKPLADQIRSSLKAFDSLGVTKDMIERRLGHGSDLITADELVELNNIGRSIKDNMTSREEWFDLKAEREKEANDLTDAIKGQQKEEGKAFVPEPCPVDTKTAFKEGSNSKPSGATLHGDDPDQEIIAQFSGCKTKGVLEWEAQNRDMLHLMSLVVQKAFLAKFKTVIKQDYPVWLSEQQNPLPGEDEGQGEPDFSEQLQQEFLKKQAAWIETVAMTQDLPMEEVDKICDRFHVRSLDRIPEEDWPDATKMINDVIPI